MDDNSNEKKKPAQAQPNWGLGVALGLGVGAALGVAMNNIAVGLAIGMAIAVVFAFSLGAASKRKPQNGGTDSAENRGD